MEGIFILLISIDDSCLEIGNSSNSLSQNTVIFGSMKNHGLTVTSNCTRATNESHINFKHLVMIYSFLKK